MKYTTAQINNYGISTLRHRGLFVLIMKLKIFGNPGYLVPCNKFADKYRDQLMNGDKLWQ